MELNPPPYEDDTIRSDQKNEEIPNTNTSHMNIFYHDFSKSVENCIPNKSNEYFYAQPQVNPLYSSFEPIQDTQNYYNYWNLQKYWCSSDNEFQYSDSFSENRLKSDECFERAQNFQEEEKVNLSACEKSYQTEPLVDVHSVDFSTCHGKKYIYLFRVIKHSSHFRNLNKRYYIQYNLISLVSNTNTNKIKKILSGKGKNSRPPRVKGVTYKLL